MPGAALKNATKKFQRIHKERVQPKARKKFGYLEKKKDYKVRAKNYQDNQAALKKLREKVLNKNPNEFHFHMINSKVDKDDGKHYEKKEEYSKDQIKLIKTQDIKYISYKRKCELEKVEKLKATCHMISDSNKPKNKKIVFVEDEEEEEIEEIVNQQAEDIEYEDALLGGTTKTQAKVYRELQRRQERVKQLTQILEDLMKQKQTVSSKNKEHQRIVGQVNLKRPLSCPAERAK